jgi:type IV pilus assembly protein PilY1
MTYYVYKGTGSSLERQNYYRYQIRGSVADRLDLGSGQLDAITTFTWADGITRTIDEEKQNFANWYTFSKSRRDAAKNGVSAAFSTLGDNYRIGFRPMNGTTGQLDIPLTGNFSGTNRETWFTNMLASSGSGSTPLRVALTQAGEYYRTTTGDADPWGPEEPDGLLGCRQSFTILTTDGYYNDASSSVTAINGSIGNADGDKGAPYADSRSLTLADIAMYYYANDLRSDIPNKVPTSDDDTADWQHMVTFGVALGLQGSLDPDVDLPRLKSGEISWPSTSSDSGKLDDLWHATVNGRGKFVSAATPEEFAAGLKSALDTIVQRTASSSNLGVSSTELREGSKVFQARFTSEIWTGDVWAYTVGTGGLSTTATWKASEQVPAPASRNIYTRNGTTGVTFLWDSLSTAQKALLDDDSNVLDYLRGVRTGEVSAGGTFRNRCRFWATSCIPRRFSSALRRISPMSDSPGKVHRATRSFRTTVEGRDPIMYVSANDGMLHAFDAGTGAERFAYVPSAALSAMKQLASPNYSHRFIVDGSLRVADVYDDAGGSGSWRSVLVGSQGRGGRQVFALDITDPDAFGTGKVLWEFTDSDFGKFIGKPVFTRLNTGRWAVLLGNGYNSDQNRGFLFVIDALTGALIRKIDTGACPIADDPCVSNGLADVTPWDDDGDGNVDYAYAGDLRGNVWRFDIGSATASEWKVSFGTTDCRCRSIAQGMPRQAAADHVERRGSAEPGRRRALGQLRHGQVPGRPDRADLSVQTWYGLYDNYASGTTTSPVTGRSNMAQRVVLFETATYLEGTTNVNPDRVRAISAPGDETGGDAMTDADGNYTKKGWYLDLLPPSGTAQGERMFYGTQVFSTALFATTAIPADDPCSPGGNGWLLSIDPFTGGRLNAKIFLNRDPIAVSNPDGSTTNYNVSGIGLTSIPSSPILVRSDASSGSGTSGGSGGTTGGEAGEDSEGGTDTGTTTGGNTAGSTDVLVNTSDLGILRERLNLPDRFGRMSWRELIND